MVRKAILLNSANFSKAVINLDAKSIQLIGRNNAGKTSIVGVLNFLYMPSQREWNFGKDTKETLHFYFPKLDKSYILFEIHKTYSFCILVRREENDRLVYYKVDKPYSELESSLLEEKEGIEYIKDFETIERDLIGYIKRYDAKEYSKILYGDSKRDKSVLWLTKDIRHSTFTRIYKNLLNTKTLTNAIFKESLLVADNKDKKFIVFNDANNQNITKLKRVLQEISILEKAKEQYFAFKELYNEYKAKSTYIEELLGEFNVQYLVEKRENSDSFEAERTNLEKCLEEKEQIIREKDDVNNRIAVLDYKKSEHNRKISSFDASLEKIKEIESLLGMKQAESTRIGLEIDKIKYKILRISTESYTSDKIEQLINRLTKDCSSLTSKIENFDKLLRHHISDDRETLIRLNSFLSEEVLNLDISKVLKTIGAIDGNKLSVFDGSIDVSEIDNKDLESIERLTLKLSEKQKELEKYKDIQENINNKKGLENKVKELSKEKEALDNDIAFILSKERTLKDKEECQVELEELCEKLKELSSIKVQVEGRLSTNAAKEKLCRDNINRISNEINKLENQHNELIEIGHKYDAIEPTKDIVMSAESLHKNIKSNDTMIVRLSEKKNIEYNLLKSVLNKEYGDIELFIEEVDEEMLGLDEKKSSTISLVESVTNETCKPTANLLEELQHFKSYISSINTKLKKYKISNVETIEIRLSENSNIINELEKIAKIDKQDLFTSEDEVNSRLAMLAKYIEQAKRVNISELFELVFIVDGNEKKLHEQVESNGTDIMIKMSLLMLIISNLIIQDEQNKLILYLDELAAIDDVNVKGFIDRAYENGFVCVLAAPRKITHVDRYYELFRQGKEQISIDERSSIDVKDRI